VLQCADAGELGVKRAVSLSLGSSKRDKTVVVNFAGETVEVSREGVDGDTERFVRRLAELDGTVDAIGFGGMDRYVWSEGRRYEFACAAKLLRGAVKTPVLDGSGLKNTLERSAVEHLAKSGEIDFAHSKTLLVSGVDRFGMAEAIASSGGPIVFGDLMFGLGMPIPLRGISALRTAAKLLLPVVLRMPLSVLYPTGSKQETIEPKHEAWYRWADIVAGDFLYIRRHLPTVESGAMAGKVILTNTTTEADLDELRRRGVSRLYTTTPQFDGRSFGTNVMEALLVALGGGEPLDSQGCAAWIERLGWKPNRIDLAG